MAGLVKGDSLPSCNRALATRAAPSRTTCIALTFSLGLEFRGMRVGLHRRRRGLQGSGLRDGGALRHSLSPRRVSKASARAANSEPDGLSAGTGSPVARLSATTAL